MKRRVRQAIHAAETAKLKRRNTETMAAGAENSGENISFDAAVDALARLVMTKKIALTDAVRIGCDAKSGEKYQAYSCRIKAAIERLDAEQQSSKYPPLTEQERSFRRAAKLPV